MHQFKVAASVTLLIPHEPVEFSLPFTTHRSLCSFTATTIVIKPGLL